MRGQPTTAHKILWSLQELAKEGTSIPHPILRIQPTCVLYSYTITYPWIRTSKQQDGHFSILHGLEKAGNMMAMWFALSYSNFSVMGLIIFRDINCMQFAWDSSCAPISTPKLTGL